MCHYDLHQHQPCWAFVQQVLKFLDQLHHHVLEAEVPTEVRTGQAAAAPTRGHLRLDARGEKVWQPAQQHQRVGSQGGQCLGEIGGWIFGTAG